MKEIKLKVIKSNSITGENIFSLSSGKNIIGRNENFSTIVIPEQGVSRTHCSITIKENEEVWLTDENSGNGTFLNSSKITTTCRLKHKDLIKVGDTLLEIQFPEKSLPLNNKKNNTKQQPADLKSSKKFKVNKTIIILTIITLILFILICQKKTGKNNYPTISDCSQTYSWTEHSLTFLHPPSWKRIKKSKQDLFGLTYFERSNLFFGRKYNNLRVTFIVDILDTLPDSVELASLADTSNNKFPRVLAFRKQYTSIEKILIDKKPALLCYSPSFKAGKIELKTIEAILKTDNKRVLLVGVAPSSLFNNFKPLFLHMINSFKILPSQKQYKKPENFIAEVNGIYKSASSLANQRHLKASNLYTSLKKFKHAAILLNLYDYNKNTQLRNIVIKEYKQNKNILENKIKDLKFNIKRGKKTREFNIVLESANQILNLIPDQDNKNHQYAKKILSKYKKKK